MRAVHSEYAFMAMNDDVMGEAVVVQAEQLRKQAITASAADAAGAADAPTEVTADALTRHKAVHKATPRSGGVRSLRACTNCAAARVKCSGMRDGRSSRDRSDDRDEVNQLPSNGAAGNGTDATAPSAEPSQQQAVVQQSNAFVGAVSNADISDPIILPKNIFSADVMDAQEPPAADQFVNDIPAHLQLLTNLPDFATQAGITCSPRSGPEGCALPEAYFEPNYLSSLNWLSSQFQFAGPEVRQHSPLNAAAAAAAAVSFRLVHQEPPSSGAATDVQRAANNADENLHAARSDETFSPGNAQVQTRANSHCQAPESDGNSGRLYVEGNGARLPRNGRRRKSVMSAALGAHFELLAGIEQHPVPMVFGFHETALDSLEGPAGYELVSGDIYGDMLQLFDRTCISSAMFPPFSTAFFPSRRSLNHMVSSYFLEFNSVFPVLRPADVQASSRWTPLLLLSMAAIGSHYIELTSNALLSIAFHELVRRCVLLVFHSTTPDIDAWKRREAQVRTAASIWLLDTMIGYHFQSTPLIPWSTDILLPCEESLWENPHMQAANGAMVLYMEKRLPAQAGEFAKICVIHGLYRTLWQVACTTMFPLHSWTPTADRIDCNSLPRETHLHRVPIYQKWRNASCDVIDSIIRLATFIAQGDASNGSIEDDRNRIHRWTTEDQFKARLAMVHAGVGFWHARRYSIGAFYEPTNTFLTTLAVWAYSLFFDHPQHCASNQGAGDYHSSEANDQSEGSDDSVVPSFIQLDRPTDDELVQFYVKHGSSMDALISGIGNIQGPDAPVKTLKEGRKILCQMTNWGICTRYIWTLSQLISHCEKAQT
ncbi:hypothetical protein KEM54_006495 [Ascosphaera aggregata]|nr:hypothetical protein KEM54_006495 [Ascosphaera aggregata]